MASDRILVGDCLEIMSGMSDDSVDLVFGSPAYEDARSYGIDFNLRGQDWVDWCVPRFMECLRVCKGLVAWVVEGKTRQFRYSCTPALLMADLHRAGVHLRKPPVYQRVGIPGSGGPDWLRNDWEFIVCATSGGKLPWSDNTAMGHPPKWAPSGEMSNRLSSGSRVNQWGHSIDSGATVVSEDGQVRSKGRRPSHNQTPFGPRPTEACGREGYKKTYFNAKGHPGQRRLERGNPKGSPGSQPVLANPGNVIERTYTVDEVAALLEEAQNVKKYVVGGGVMGDKICHKNEAPFSESLAKFFVLSYCPPGGTVLDPFSGSGTTAVVAHKNGRKAIAIDIRASQVELTKKRLADYATLFTVPTT